MIIRYSIPPQASLKEEKNVSEEGSGAHHTEVRALKQNRFGGPCPDLDNYLSFCVCELHVIHFLSLWFSRALERHVWGIIRSRANHPGIPHRFNLTLPPQQPPIHPCVPRLNKANLNVRGHGGGG